MKTLEKNRIAEHQNGSTDDMLLQQAVELPEFKEETARFVVVGISPLIVHNWSKKAIAMMLGKQLGEAKAGRKAKDPFDDFRGSLYPVEGKSGLYGVPAPAFKACAVSAANAVEEKMTQMRQAFHV